MNKFDRHAAIPHGAMGRAVHRLILRREQGFDLVVGRVDRAGATGFVRALAAKRERRLGERLDFLRAIYRWCFRCHASRDSVRVLSLVDAHYIIVRGSRPAVVGLSRTAYHGWPGRPMRILAVGADDPVVTHSAGDLLGRG